MKNVVMDKSYDPSSFEGGIYERLEKAGAYRPSSKKSQPFSVVMPPPNVTGVLHMGHALNITLQDILVRYQRMRGKRTLWVPGTDHAGIATQYVMEKKLHEEGKRRTDFTREEFLDMTWRLKEKHHDTIVSQIRSMGASCDWEHERFTLDEGLSRAVRECFVQLYRKGLVYKDKYLVNYCPRCKTALSDDEVTYKSVDSFLWSISYPFADGEGSITIATTRPETLFGDTAVAVNPKDERYAGIVGKKVCLPLTDRQIEIIADSFVDIEYGSGMVKITPAHDPHDRECGIRHNLEVINILNPDGTLNSNVPEKYRGLDVLTARKMVCEDLESLGLMVSKEPLSHEVGHCYRCGTPIEPYLSDQWFVKMDGMAKKALEALEKGEIAFYPKKWEATYVNWLKNIRDWCISRQLWWGHRIPVWYCEDCGEMTVSVSDVQFCSKCFSQNIRQEEDVLDTWFSSWLWPMSVMGWPDATEDFLDFFPTSTLVTAYDIIFFWVSRMIMASLEFTGKAPFKDIYITALVRDKQGRKMSKSLGNGIDPLEVIKLYGSDAMKFTLSYQAVQGQDILIDMDSFKFGSKFANKVWNASRYILMNIEGRELIDVRKLFLDVFDKWIFTRFNNAVERTREAYESYRINEAAQAAYDFFWNDFCDWYVEITKRGLYSDNSREKNKCVSVLLFILENSLRLLHPLIPLVTEEIYSKLPVKGNGPLALQSFPEPYTSFKAQDCENMVSSLQNAVKMIRNLKVVLDIPAQQKCDAVIVADDAETQAFLEKNADVIVTLSSLQSVSFRNKRESGVIYSASMSIMAGIRKPDGFNGEERAVSVKKEIESLEAERDKSQKKLDNEDFVSKAKPEAVDKERQKLDEFLQKLDKLRQVLKILQDA